MAEQCVINVLARHSALEATHTHTLAHTQTEYNCSSRKYRWHSKIPLGLVDNYEHTHIAAAAVSGGGINIAKHLNIFD